MKKLLLSMAMLIGFFTMSAEPVVVDFSNATGLPTAESENPTTAKINDVDFSFVNCKKGTYSGASYLQISGKNYEGKAYMEFTAPFAVEKITFHTGTNASTNVTLQLYANDVAVGSALAFNAKDANFTIEIPAANQAAGTKYKLATTNKYNAQITTITFNGDGQPVVPPVVETKKVANIAAFLEAKDATNPSEFTSPVTAIYQNGSYLYVKDATGDLLIYGTLDTKYNNGDAIPAGFTGTYKDFNGLYEMVPDKATFKAGTAGTAVEPEEMTIEDLSTDIVNKYVVIKNVTLVATDNAANFTMTDETGEITLHNNFTNAQYCTVLGITAGTGLTVTGFVGVYQNTVQFNPIEVTDGSGMQTVAAPAFAPAAGEIAEGTEVAITCATEGASIYYTLDGTEPTAASTLYTAAIVINEDTTVKAIAVKEGWKDSQVVTVAYTVKKPLVIAGDATFNFELPNSLNPAQEAPTAETPSGATIDGIKFTNNGVTVEFAAGSSGTRMYYGFTTGVEARLYKTGTVTISAPEGKLISKIEFYGAGIGNLSVDKTAVANKVWTSAEGVNKFVATAVAEQETTNGRVDFKGIGVYLIDNAGIGNVEIDANAPAEYFNLQGVRVENPTNGLYIRRQGNKVSKVVL